jgi:hypothetical protein
MVSSAEGWAVGSLQTANSSSIFDVSALILHYANGRWTPASIVGLPASKIAFLTGVSMVSPHEGWAVGEIYGNTPGKDQGTSYMLVLHYLNGVWSRVAWTHIGALNGVDALPTGDMWAVGAVTGVGPSAVVHMHDGAFAGLLETVPGSLNAVQIFSTQSGWDGWAVGDGAATVHDQDSVWTREDYTIHGFTISNLSLVSPTEGWAVGHAAGASANSSPNWAATLFHLHNGKWSIYPLTGL